MKSDFLLNKVGKTWGYSIPALDETGLVKTGFSTRLGEVKKGDSRSALEFCNAMGIYPKEVRFCGQVHGSKVVDAYSYTKDADGIMTDRQKIALVTFYADCVPLYFIDTKNRAIALSHAGWKGTVAHIGEETLQKMHKVYGTEPEDCKIAIGPSIGKCCFEVDHPVAEQFGSEFKLSPDMIERRSNGKFHIDLVKINAEALRDRGVPKENIYKADICTSCNTNVLYSYRRERGISNRMAAIIMLI